MTNIFLNKSKLALGVFSILFLSFATSCENALDINNDPDALKEVPTTSIYTGAQVSLGYTLGGDATRMPASIVQYYAGHRGQPLEYAQYDIVPSSTDALWTNLYQAAYNLNQVENRSIAKGDLLIAGTSQILQAYTYSVLTDLFGDIPYSEALKGLKNLTPAYDKQEYVYSQLITLIDKGIANVKTNAGVKPGNTDVIFEGDVTKWEKFGNSLKLRLYNHLAKVDPSLAKNFLNTNPLLITSSADDAKLKFVDNPQSANPIYQFDVLSGRKDQAVASTIVNKMANLSDPRAKVYFKAIANGANAGKVIGNNPGDDTDDSALLLYSRVGSAYASIDSPVYFLSASEVNFIKAEIYLRDGNKVSAKTAYENAINENFVSLSVAGAAAYIAKPEVAFDDTLERLMEQKWIAMYQSAFESFTDYRRTGFPVLNPAANNLTEDIVPRRLPYCQKEINVNGNSLSNGPGIPATYVDLKKRVWWDK